MSADGSNIFIQPLDRSKERQLTHFNNRQAIMDIAWSRDGKRLAVARNVSSQDIVVFRGINPKPCPWRILPQAAIGA
jgi:hypothetical protein